MQTNKKPKIFIFPPVKVRIIYKFKIYKWNILILLKNNNNNKKPSVTKIATLIYINSHKSSIHRVSQFLDIVSFNLLCQFISDCCRPFDRTKTDITPSDAWLESSPWLLPISCVSNHNPISKIHHHQVCNEDAFLVSRGCFGRDSLIALDVSSRSFCCVMQGLRRQNGFSTG